MSRTADRTFSRAMTHLEETDPRTAFIMRKKILQLKQEAMTWRLKAQAQTPSTETTKKPLTGTEQNS